MSSSASRPCVSAAAPHSRLSHSTIAVFWIIAFVRFSFFFLICTDTETPKSEQTQHTHTHTHQIGCVYLSLADICVQLNCTGTRVTTHMTHTQTIFDSHRCKMRCMTKSTFAGVCPFARRCRQSV